MATTREENSSEKSATQEPPEGHDWTAEIIIAVVAVILILGTVVAGGGKKKKKTSPPIDEGVRALVLPTADRARTVVIPPCGTGTRVSSRNVAALLETAGTTVLRLPQAEQGRTLLIPRCASSTSEAGAEMVVQVPSSVFVLTTGAATSIGSLGSPDGKKTNTIGARSQVIVPSASEAETVVVPPCTSTGRVAQATVLAARPDSPTVLIAPAC